MGVDPVSLAVNAALMAANMALTASQSFEGPRLKDLRVTVADYGTPYTYGYGKPRPSSGVVIWAEPLREVEEEEKTKGGKYTRYRYFATWAVQFADHQIDEVLRVWFDEHLVYDATGAGPISPFSTGEDGGAITDYMRIYKGEPTAQPDPRMQATIDEEHGAGSTRAFRNEAGLVFEELPLEKLGNRIPIVKVEFTSNGVGAFPVQTVPAMNGAPFTNMLGMTFSPDYSRLMWGHTGAYQIWDVAARAPMISGSLLPDTSTQDIYGISALDGRIYAANGQNIYVYPPDGIGPSQLLVDTGVGLSANARVFEYGGTGFEIVVCPPFSASDRKIIYYVIELVVGDTLALSGYDFLPYSYVKDAGVGDVWAVGTSTTHVVLYNVTRQGDGPYVLAAPLAPLGLSGYISAYAFHYVSGTADHFVVMLGGSVFVTMDREGGGIAHTQTGYSTSFPQQIQNVRPGAASFYIGAPTSMHQISSNDLTLVRSIDFADFDIGANEALYDPVNHALITANHLSGDVNWLYLDRASGDPVTLRTIVEDVSDRVGLLSSDIDAIDLTQEITGYSWTQGSGKAILEPLLEAYDSDVRPHDFELEFIQRGHVSLGAISVGDMGAGGGTRYKVTRTLDSDLPLAVDFTHADPAMDQQPNTQNARRSASATDSARAQSIDVSTLVMDVDEARQRAELYLRRVWFKAEAYDLSLTRGWSKLEPADIYTLDLDGEAKTARLKAIEWGANGVLATSWERDDANAHELTVLPGQPGDGYVPPVVVTPGYSKGFVLDIPLVEDADDGLILYTAAAPYSNDVTVWPGATVFQSSDAGATYSEQFSSIPSGEPVTWGYASDALDDALATVVDRASSVTIALQYGSLSSVTETQMLNGANKALLGDEIIRFQTATLIGANTYTLTNLKRGDRGTEQHTGSHAAGERFVMLDDRTRETMGASDIGDALYFKTITLAGSTGFPDSLTYTGASAKPYSPAHLKVEDDGGDLVATWVRRTRVGGEWRDGQDAPLGEGSESYVVQILNGSGTVIRTISASTETATYTAAQQSSDSNAGVTLRVMQVSATAGNGFPADIAI